MRRVARTDANHLPIITNLRRCGLSVVSLHQLGLGVPDTLIASPDKMRLVELKVKGGTLTPAQIEFIEKWRGPEIGICECTEEVLEFFYSS